jgi:hypothetical protein
MHIHIHIGIHIHIHTFLLMKLPVEKSHQEHKFYFLYACYL